MPNFTTQNEPALAAPIEVARNLAEVYFIEKEAKEEKDALRLDFFLVAALARKDTTLAQKTVAVPETVADEDARAYVEQYNSGWLIVDEKSSHQFIIEQDPDLLAYEISIPVEGGVIDSKGKEHPGYTVIKEVRSGSPMFDDERLAIDDPDLYHRATQLQNEDGLRTLGGTMGLSDAKLDKWLDSITDWPRVPRHPDDLSDEDAEAVKQYAFEGPKTKALRVRYAKDEEL